MNHPGKNQVIDIQPGTIVTGKWYSRSYRIVKKLGSGACGAVFLAQYNRTPVAIKFGFNQTTITSEVNVLKSFQKVQGTPLGPSLMDVDDWVKRDGTTTSFYVMEYLRGKELIPFMQSHGEEWLGVLMVQLLEDLEKLHQAGWVFGDLKTENLIVTYPPARLRWIDVGGTTLQGRAIKEYTEFYDRGYWGMGSRKAEASYDLFALAMVMLHIYYPKRFERGKDGEKTLATKLNQCKELRAYRGVIHHALSGKFHSSGQMKAAVQQIVWDDRLRQQSSKSSGTPSRVQRKQAAPRHKSGVPAPVPKKSHAVWEGMGILALAGMFYTIYILMQWM
ncbi:protein kinase family protein [Pontibacillus salicampi]|uniref:Protein kinase family protein n=1 Tax=Pontibacillus salicampi TaxID=1449801 RepID=A0ABV6LTB1_9BACI